MKTRAAFIFLLALTAPALAQAPSGGDTPGSATNKTPPPVTGEQVYKQVCQACHMADGMGGKGAAMIPALAKNAKLEEPGYPIGMIMQGRGAMPPLTDLLGPAQIAGVVTYVRTHFGNNYKKPVTEAEVKMMMGQ
ncbi:MAG: cytochrome c [Alphaproteobacteria bacterium]|nr:cytochrome c [Alphaproteobacteria bacterium]